MNRSAARWISGIFCTALLLGLLTGCSQEVTKEKNVVKILYSNSFKQVEELVESTYDDIDLQVEISLDYNEQLRRLERGVGPDLVFTMQLDSNTAQKYLLDLSDTKASSSYDGTIMNSLKLEGKTYMLPLPGVYRGYVVNETLFKHAGLPLPTNNAELVDSLLKLKEKGVGIGEDNFNFSILSDYNPSIGMFYIGCMVPDFLGTVDGVKWLDNFNHKEAAFSGIWEQCFSLSDSLIEAGVMDASAIARQRNSILARQRLSNGTLAAAFGDSALYYECIAGSQEAAKEDASKAYTYRMLPLFSDEGNESWFLFSPSALIGINNSLSKESQDACKRILELLSTPDGQAALIEDLGTGMSCLRDYPHSEDSIPEGVSEYVKSGYVYNVMFPGKTVEYLGGYVRKIMNGTCTKEEALQAIDHLFLDGEEEPPDDFTVIGYIGQDLILENFNVRLGETEIGNFVADCIAEAAGAPIAVVNGGGIRASLYQGVVYGEDLSALCPFDNQIIIIETDGKTIWEMLENSVSACTNEFPSGRYLQVSGIHYTYDSSKPVGSRLVNVTLPDGKALDLNTKYQLAVTDYMAGEKSYAEGNGDGYTMLNYYDLSTPKGNVELITETGLFYRDAIAIYFERHRETVAGIQLEGRILDLAQEK